MDPAGVERDTQTLARRIAELGDGERSRVFRMSWWSDRMMDWAMSRPAFKTQLFRFVDVFPALEGREDIARHLAEYFDGVDVPKALDLGVDLADRVPFGAAVEARVARKNIARMAEQFIVGSTPAEAVDGLHALWRSGSAATVDLLGEKTVVRRRSRSLPGPGARAPRGAVRRGAVVGPGRPPRARRPRPAAPRQREHQAHRPGDALRAAQPHRGHRLRQGAHPTDPAHGARPRRARALRHGALRRQGPHPVACSASCCPRTSSPTWRRGS